MTACATAALDFAQLSSLFPAVGVAIASAQNCFTSSEHNCSYARFLPPKDHQMQGFSPGLFDRLADDDQQRQTSQRGARASALEECKRSITDDLESLLNTRSALMPPVLETYPAVSGSVVNYGLIDFAGMCMTSDTDQQQICTAVRQAIERHEPRLHKVAVALRPKKGAINRVEFVITARLRSAPQTEPMHFNAVFRPSLQRYAIEGIS
jgi:type VI secretion system protein ImpF